MVSWIGWILRVCDALSEMKSVVRELQGERRKSVKDRIIYINTIFNFFFILTLFFRFNWFPFLLLPHCQFAMYVYVGIYTLGWILFAEQKYFCQRCWNKFQGINCSYSWNLFLAFCNIPCTPRSTQWPCSLRHSNMLLESCGWSSPLCLYKLYFA